MLQIKLGFHANMRRHFQCVRNTVQNTKYNTTTDWKLEKKNSNQFYYDTQDTKSCFQHTKKFLKFEDALIYCMINEFKLCEQKNLALATEHNHDLIF